MNCPGHCLMFARYAPLLPRPAGPLRRLRPPAPLRAQRRDPGSDPRPDLLPGRRATSSARRSRSGAEIDAFIDPDRRVLLDLRLHGRGGRPLDPPGRSRWARPSCGAGPRTQLGDCARDARHRLHDQPGGGGVLRPEARVPGEGRHRPPLAARHHAARLQHAGALRPRTTSARTTSRTGR